MEFKESAAIENAQRRLSFSYINWLDKPKFEEYLNTRQAVYPYTDTVDSDTNVTNRIFVGKSIASSSDNPTRLEVIGTVSRKFETGGWILSVSHGCVSVEIKSDFLVLNIEDPDSFEWVRTSRDLIPSYALRGAIDEFTYEYFHVGRTIPRDTMITASYRDARAYYLSNQFTDNVPSLFGKVHVSHKCLYAPFDQLELIFSDYEILCLKPTPNKLSILCRELIRSLAQNSNKNIELINKNSNGIIYVPESMISFIKYPSYLASGEYMLKNEKIVREDGQFELVVLDDGNLVIRSLIAPNAETNLSEESLTNLKETQVQRIIKESVNSIWLHRFQVVFFQYTRSRQKRISIYKSLPNKSPDYCLMIDDANVPNLKIDVR